MYVQYDVLYYICEKNIWTKEFKIWQMYNKIREHIYFFSFIKHLNYILIQINEFKLHTKLSQNILRYRPKICNPHDFQKLGFMFNFLWKFSYHFWIDNRGTIAVPCCWELLSTA